MTGWNLPPGCSVNDLPGNQDEPCAVCGQWEDACICPCCEVCDAVGDPACYIKHGMVRTPEQIASLAKKEAEWAADAEAEAAYDKLIDDLERKSALGEIE